MLIIITNIEPT